LELLATEQVIDGTAIADRFKEIHRSAIRSGHYAMTTDELEHACRVAWRQNARCIGRLPWHTLAVRDCRQVESPEDIFAACVSHLRQATNHGRIRPVMSVFASDQASRHRPRIWNPQLIRYAGWRRADGTVLGDPLQIEFTAVLEFLGWRPATRTPFTVLPIAISVGDGHPRLFELPPDAVLEVPIRHPELAWFEELGLRWHAVPMMCDFALRAGGLDYSAAPFNGWYMGTEIGARNLADVDRYNQLPLIADRLGLSTRSSTNLWRDRALVELNVAVLHSFRTAGVNVVDHHSASDQFIKHIDREHKLGRETPGDWSWLVPPMSGSTTRVFHRYYPTDSDPGMPHFAPQPAPWRATESRFSPVSGSGSSAHPTCPVVAGARAG
jgi:nitric-oxide synthase